MYRHCEAVKLEALFTFSLGSRFIASSTGDSLNSLDDVVVYVTVSLAMPRTIMETSLWHLYKGFFRLG